MEPRTTDKVSIRSCVQGGKLKSSQRPVLAPRIGCLDFRSSLDQLLCCLSYTKWASVLIFNCYTVHYHKLTAWNNTTYCLIVSGSRNLGTICWALCWESPEAKYKVLARAVTSSVTSSKIAVSRIQFSVAAGWRTSASKEHSSSRVSWFSLQTGSLLPLRSMGAEISDASPLFEMLTWLGQIHLV